MSDRPPGPKEWIGVALLCGCAVLSALLELLFVPLYAGHVIMPVVVVVALVGNMALPRLGFGLVERAAGAVLPVAFWLVTLLGFSLAVRPEGDILVLGRPDQEYTFYGLLLVGAGAGLATIIVVVTGGARPIAAPPGRRAQPVQPPAGRPGNGSGVKSAKPSVRPAAKSNAKSPAKPGAKPRPNTRSKR